MIFGQYYFLPFHTYLHGHTLFIKSKKSKKMNKSPIKEAIEILERFNENLDFSKEAKTSVSCSISLLEPLLEKERKLYVSMCIGLIDKLADVVDRGEFDKFDENKIVDFITNFFNEKQKPIHGSYEHLLSLGRGRSKN